MEDKRRVLDGKRIYLRPLEEADADDITENVNDPEVVKWTLLIPYPYPDDGAIQFIRMAEKSMLERSSYIFGIILKKSDRLIGVISLDKVEWTHRVSKIGYWLGKDHWNNGYMTEATALLTAFGFEQLGLFRMEAVILEGNVRSAKVLTKCRFRKEGIERSRYQKDGRRFNGTLYSLLPSDLGRG
ncbi:MAG: GNAT family N-acetyltransferase [Thermoplasmata archaeon]|nr:GNAT family N-acetyltransferase [Thermoplasmata archaeon]